MAKKKVEYGPDEAKTSYAVNQWRIASSDITVSEYERAKLAFEMRSWFGPARRGQHQARDKQFRNWFAGNVEGGKGPTTALRQAKAFQVFPGQDDWSKFGGYMGVALLAHLPTRDRKTLVKALEERMRETGKDSVAYWLVKKIGRELEITSNGSRVSGGPRVNVIVTRKMVMGFLLHMAEHYDEGIMDLDPELRPLVAKFCIDHAMPVFREDVIAEAEGRTQKKPSKAKQKLVAQLTS